MSAAFRGKNKYGMGEYSRPSDEDEAAVWCLHNNICITPRQHEWGQRTWVIDIEKGVYPNRKLVGTSPDHYGPGRIWEKVAEYQLYYYRKYAK